MSAKASVADLSELHGELTKAFRDRIKSGGATPADLNAARQFLKDNSISADLDTNPELQGLLAEIPTGEELDRMTLGNPPQ